MFSEELLNIASEKIEICKGCSFLFSSLLPLNLSCGLPPFFTEGSEKIYCPCLTCLVKVVCKKDCKKARLYLKRIEYTKSRYYTMALSYIVDFHNSYKERMK